MTYFYLFTNEIYVSPYDTKHESDKWMNQKIEIGYMARHNPLTNVNKLNQGFISSGDIIVYNPSSEEPNHGISDMNCILFIVKALQEKGYIDSQSNSTIVNGDCCKSYSFKLQPSNFKIEKENNDGNF